MYRIDTRIIAALIGALALALAGCGGGGGGGGGGGPLLPSAANTLPDEYSGGGPGDKGIGDYLNSGGTWRVNLDGQVQTTLNGTVDMLGAFVYDGEADEWTINMDGTNRVFFPIGGDQYLSMGPDGRKAGLTIYDDDPSTSQYGTFGRIHYTDSGPTMDGGYIFAHAGLKTPLADMPSGGTGMYIGAFEGYVITEDSTDRLLGYVDVRAYFDDSTVSFHSDGYGEGDAYYILNGSATITGNTYQGTLSGDYRANGWDSTFGIDHTKSSLSGAFYGPDQTTLGVSETAGVVYGVDWTGEYELVGGFWAFQTYSKP